MECSDKHKAPANISHAVLQQQIIQIIRPKYKLTVTQYLTLICMQICPRYNTYITETSFKAFAVTRRVRSQGFCRSEGQFKTKSILNRSAVCCMGHLMIKTETEGIVKVCGTTLKG